MVLDKSVGVATIAQISNDKQNYGICVAIRMLMKENVNEVKVTILVVY